MNKTKQNEIIASSSFKELLEARLKGKWEPWLKTDHKNDSVVSSIVTNVSVWCRMLMVEEGIGSWEGGYVGNLYFLLNVSVNLKVSKK